MKKEFRVKRNEDFSKIIARKKSFANSCFIIYKDENQIGHGRVGISVSKKLGNAVTRNKIKRQLKSIISKKNYQNGFNCIIIVGRDILNKDYCTMEKDLNQLFQNIDLIKEKKDA